MAEAAEWARNRETFGKPLVGHQSIRIKPADMERQIEATQAWVDLAAWQVKEGKDRPADFAMLTVQATRLPAAVAVEAAQVLGGASTAERRVGNEGVRPRRSGRWPLHKNKKTSQTTQ